MALTDGSRDELRRLAVHIATCPIVDLCLRNDNLDHPCSTVVRQNNPVRESPRALPEPWYGHLAQARILFISSNPGGGRTESQQAAAEPDSEDPENILVRAEDALDGVRVDEVGKYWKSVHELAVQLLGVADDTLRPGTDYAITEVVHCGSAGQAAGDVDKAVFECAPRYTPMLLQLAAAQVIVLVGSIARDWFSNHLLRGPLRTGGVSEPEIVEGRSRIFIAIAHPSAWEAAGKGFSPAQIAAAQTFLAGSR